jgi:hypothetical protein
MNFSETLFTYTYGIHTRPSGFSHLFTLGINNRVSETLRITAELMITSQAADFFNQILSFLAYGRSSVVKTLNETGEWLELKL